MLVEEKGLVRLKGVPHHDVSIGEALDADSQESVTHVAVTNLDHRIKVGVNDFGEVLRDNLCHHLQLGKVVGLVGLDNHVDREGGKVADGHLVRGRVLHNLSASVQRLEHLIVPRFCWLLFLLQASL